MKILVVNCGSSSVKYGLYAMPEEKLLARGLIEKIGLAASIHGHEAGNQKWKRDTQCKDHTAALRHMADALMEPEDGVISAPEEVVAIGHRVVHGGEAFNESTVITAEVERTIEALFPLAPLHNPPNLKGVRSAREIFPHAVHVAVFDTTFHRHIPPHAFHYAIPYELYQKHHVRRYGFHGTSYRYVAGRVAQLMGVPENRLNAILCHLGNGSSIAAVKDGLAVDTSMGLTPLEGLIMGTRSGDIDPGVIFHLMGALEMSPAQVDKLLNQESGILGLSGVSSDMRAIEEAAAAGNRRARLALACYQYRVRKYIGAYMAVLGRVDAIVFTAGIGEHCAETRQAILEDMEPLGIVLDKEVNLKTRAVEQCVSVPESRTQAWVVPTNEEVMIARDTYHLAGNG